MVCIIQTSVHDQRSTTKLFTPTSQTGAHEIRLVLNDSYHNAITLWPSVDAKSNTGCGHNEIAYSTTLVNMCVLRGTKLQIQSQGNVANMHAFV
jgi:hypothetical protein